MKTLIALFAMWPLIAGCIADGATAPDSGVVALTPDASVSSEILATYELSARAYQQAHGLSLEWKEWVISHKDRYAVAYVRARVSPPIVKVAVRYDRPIIYDPPWVSEEDHLNELEQLVVWQFPSWYFVFGVPEMDADTVLVLGYSGQDSYADGHTVYLVWESLFAHEFGHTINLAHHYCDAYGNDLCDERPNGEEYCIMGRTSVSWGPVERFVLNLPDERSDDEIVSLVQDINRRYPVGYP